MNVEAYLNGIFPRSDFALESGSSWLKGRVTKDDYYKILEKETIELIELQHNLGLDYVTDGQLFWDDFLRQIAIALELHRENSNANENPVTRQIYTNTFYRKPIILNKIGNGKEIIDTEFINKTQEGKRKIILPSPFALAYLSDGIHRNEDGTIKNDIFAEVLLNIAKILNNEIHRLEKESKISFVQFNEPCIAYADEAKSFWSIINESLRIATKDVKAITSLHLYNGDVSKFLPELLELPVNRIGFDAYATNIRKFADSKKFLEIGIINSKNSLIEKPEAIVKYARQIQDTINPEGLALVPNRPLELVPQQIAIKKIENLAKAAHLLRD
ncbi:hypothetical protein HYX02_04720 [Candidatus Woesearchaeota archaeon]|nr:hypothetical protein [Candidatus Woesearchaeota archaeon]